MLSLFICESLTVQSPNRSTISVRNPLTPNVVTSWVEISRDVERGLQGRIPWRVAQPYAVPQAPSSLSSHLPHHSPLVIPKKAYLQQRQWAQSEKCSHAPVTITSSLRASTPSSTPGQEVLGNRSATGTKGGLVADHTSRTWELVARWWSSRCSQPPLPLLHSWLQMLGLSFCKPCLPFPAGSWLGFACQGCQGCHRECEGWRKMETFSFVCFPLLSALPQQHVSPHGSGGGFQQRRWLQFVVVPRPGPSTLSPLWNTAPAAGTASCGVESQLQTPSSEHWVPFEHASSREGRVPALQAPSRNFSSFSNPTFSLCSPISTGDSSFL